MSAVAGGRPSRRCGGGRRGCRRSSSCRSCVYLVLWALTPDGAGWGYVLFPLVTIGLLVTVGFGLYLGLLAAVALRSWPDRSRVAATVTALGSVLPVAALGATADSTTQRALWAGLALVVAGVVGAVTLADARRIARPRPR